MSNSLEFERAGWFIGIYKDYKQNQTFIRVEVC